jgi:hypothetical protein
VVWTKIEIDYLVAFYSKHNRLSLSLFTVNLVAIVAEPYTECPHVRLAVTVS